MAVLGLDYSQDVLVTHWTVFLLAQPTVDALAVEFVAALHLLVLLELAEDIEANRASILSGVAIADPGPFAYRVYLSLRQSF